MKRFLLFIFILSLQAYLYSQNTIPTSGTISPVSSSINIILVYNYATTQIQHQVTTNANGYFEDSLLVSLPFGNLNLLFADCNGDTITLVDD